LGGREGAGVGEEKAQIRLREWERLPWRGCGDPDWKRGGVGGLTMGFR